MEFTNIKMRTLLFVFISLISNSIFGQRYIFVSKTDLKLSVIQNSDTIFQCPIAVGKNYGNKSKIGDMKTPEGIFSIGSIENSTKWKHDFKDGKGVRKGAYGPFFFRLKIPKFNSIGIHGTCKPESIGTRDSEGCIRLHNNDLQKLRDLIYLGMAVIINKDEYVYAK